MKSLLDLFKQVTQKEEFDAIKIGLACRKKSVHGHTGKSETEEKIATRM